TGVGVTNNYTATNTVGLGATTYTFGTSNPTGTDEFFAFCTPLVSVTQTNYAAGTKSPVTMTGEATKGRPIAGGRRIVRLPVPQLQPGVPTIVPVTCQAKAVLQDSQEPGLTVKEYILGPNTGMIVTAAAGSAPATGSTTF